MLQAMPGAMLGGCSKQCTQRTQRTNATNARISHLFEESLVGNRARVSSPFELLAKNCEECADERRASA